MPSPAPSDREEDEADDGILLACRPSRHGANNDEYSSSLDFSSSCLLMYCDSTVILLRQVLRKCLQCEVSTLEFVQR